MMCALLSQDAIAKDSFYPDKVVLGHGDVDKVLSHAEEVLEGELHVEAQEHFYLEPQVTIAYPQEDGGLEMYCCTQAPHLLQVGQITVTLCAALVLLYVRPLLCAGTYHSYTLCDNGIAVCKVFAICRYMLELHLCDTVFAA